MHEISSISGRDEVFVAGKPAWHGLGRRVNEAQTSESAIRLAGLNWKVHQRSIHLPCGQEIPDRIANVRLKPDGRDHFLGCVGRQYRLIQNDEAFGFVDDLIGQGDAVFETAGALKDGRRIWVLARLPENLRINSEDQIKRYLLLCNGHDGAMACRVFFTPTRVVCQNTLSVALRGRRAGDGITIRHSGKVKQKLEEARRVLGLAQDHFGELGSVFRRMKSTDFDVRQARDYFETLVPDVPADAGAKSKNRVRRVRSELLNCFRVEVDELAGRTVWAAFNAVSRWNDHVSFKRRPSASLETRFENILWGGGKQLRQQAFDLALAALN